MRPSRPSQRHDRAKLIGATAVWVTVGLCAALLMATIGEVWVRVGIERQNQQLRVQNAQLQRDVQTTDDAVRDAESPATIERVARSWGYVRAGDHPVLVVPSSKP